MTHPAGVLAHVVRVLEQLKIRYHVGGSIASTRRGTYRSTEDVDIVVDLDRADLDALEQALAPDFYVSRSAMAEALATGGTFNAIGLEAAELGISDLLARARARARFE